MSNDNNKSIHDFDFTRLDLFPDFINIFNHNVRQLDLQRPDKGCCYEKELYSKYKEFYGYVFFIA